jgi:glutaredoxin
VRVLTLYTKPDCHLCEEALRTLREVCAELLLAEPGMRAVGECQPASVEPGMRAVGECQPASAEREMLAETGADWGDTRSARIPEAASAEGACRPAPVAGEGLPAPVEVELLVRDITTDEALHRAYFERIPVVVLDGEELFEYFVDAELLREKLESGR